MIKSILLFLTVHCFIGLVFLINQTNSSPIGSDRVDVRVSPPQAPVPPVSPPINNVVTQPKILNSEQLVHNLHIAIAIVRTKNGTKSGSLEFRENSEGKVKIEGKVEGLAKGPHGMHVHQFGDLSQGCSCVGQHFDAHKYGIVPHGGIAWGHTGDFGNIFADDKGVAHVYINNSSVQLHGDASIIGRAIVIHASKDDLGKGHTYHSHVDGNVGDAVACGIVAWDNPTS